MKESLKFLQSFKEEKIKGFIITLYVVGIIGSAIPLTRELFIMLTPFVLLLSFAIILWFHISGFDSKTTIVFSIVFLASYLVEVAGVRTGQIFGTYSYGKGLGIKLLDTPVLIGLNWVLLVYCTAEIFEKIPSGTVVKIAGASLLMVIYDLIMEQVAPKMDMWSFEGGSPPLMNYLAWFILAIIFHSILKLAGIKIPNKFAPLIFYCQGIFFIILFIIFKITE